MKHIAVYLLTLIFFVYSIGIEVHHHKCIQHKTLAISLFFNADCPCEHDKCSSETQTKCNQCSTEHSKANRNDHMSTINAFSKEIQDKCCVEFSENYSIDSGFVIDYIKLINKVPNQSNPELIPIIDLISLQTPKEINIKSPPEISNHISLNIISYIQKASASTELPAII